MEKIQITDVVVNQLKSWQDLTGEWYATIDVDFLLAEPETFTVFGASYSIDRIKLSDSYFGSFDMEVELHYAAGQRTPFTGLPVNNHLIQQIIDRVVLEQEEGGKLEGWALQDSLRDQLEADALFAGLGL